ncbi:MAG: hypothetical protein V1802_02860 [Candidatus Aenigmatarchaeota archaeon]
MIKYVKSDDNVRIAKELENELFISSQNFRPRMTNLIEKIVMEDEDISCGMKEIKSLEKEMNSKILCYAEDLCVQIRNISEWARGDKDRLYIHGMVYSFVKKYFKLDVLGRFDDFQVQINDDNMPNGGYPASTTVYILKKIPELLFVEDDINKESADLCKGKQREEYIKTKDANGDWRYTGTIYRQYSPLGSLYLFRRLSTPLNKDDESTSKISREAEEIHASLLKEGKINYTNDIEY